MVTHSPPHNAILKRVLQVPGTGKSDAHLGDQEVEIGMGIHNESGILKSQLPSSEELIRKMLNFIIDINDPERGYVPFKHDGKDEVVLLINNLYVF